MTDAGTLVADLLAAIEATEADARDAGSRSLTWARAEHPSVPWGVEDAPAEILSGGRVYMTFETDRGAPLAVAHVLRHDPASVLRRCAADRKLVQRHKPVTDADGNGEYCFHCAETWPCPDLLDRAEAYGLPIE